MSKGPRSRRSYKGAAAHYTAIIKRDGKWWIGWIEEIRGVNSQGRTRKELMANLRSALKEMLEMNRAEARAGADGDFEEASVAV